MSDKPNPDIKVFRAQPPEERKKLVATVGQKVFHQSIVPDSILKDEFLNSLINSSLPKNYNFEVHKTIWKIETTGAKRVLLQLPEGLIRFGTVLIDVMSAYLQQSQNRDDVRFIVMGDLTYGACCIDDILASSIGCDLVVHYAHSCLIPINQLDDNVKYLYIFLDIKFDLKHLLDCITHNFCPNDHKIALASTIQFVPSTHEVARRLRQKGFDIILPQSRPLSSGEVLGCTAPKLESYYNTIIFICDGRFHLEALMIANPSVKAFRYDPYSRTLTHEVYAIDEMLKLRNSAIDTAVEFIRKGGTFGFVLGTLGRQGSEKVFNRLVDRFKKNTTCKCMEVMMPEVTQDHLKLFDKVDVWVQVACPRLSIDWGSGFETPLLNPYEFSQCLKIFLKPDGDFAGHNLNYPMDYYAKNSCGDHTPNHCCQNNQNCQCIS